MRKAVTTAAAAVVLAAILWLVGTDFRLKKEFRQIAIGDPKNEVTASIGRPRYVVRCASYGGNPLPGCVEEYAYLSLLSFTDVWTVDFDDNDRVIRKYRYRSP